MQDQNRNSLETFDTELIAALRRTSPSMIAQELASVQPMPDMPDWDALGRAYAAIVASHGKGPFIPRPMASTLTETAIEKIKSLSPEDAALLDSPIGCFDVKVGF